MRQITITILPFSPVSNAHNTITITFTITTIVSLYLRHPLPPLRHSLFLLGDSRFTLLARPRGMPRVLLVPPSCPRVAAPPPHTDVGRTSENAALRRCLALLARLLACLLAVTSFAEWSSRSWLSALHGSIWKQWLSCLFLYSHFTSLLFLRKRTLITISLCKQKQKNKYLATREREKERQPQCNPSVPFINSRSRKHKDHRLISWSYHGSRSSQTRGFLGTLSQLYSTTLPFILQRLEIFVLLVPSKGFDISLSLGENKAIPSTSIDRIYYSRVHDQYMADINRFCMPVWLVTEQTHNHRHHN